MNKLTQQLVQLSMTRPTGLIDAELQKITYGIKRYHRWLFTSITFAM
jgi:hypothetical protein